MSAPPWSNREVPASMRFVAGVIALSEIVIIASIVWIQFLRPYYPASVAVAETVAFGYVALVCSRVALTGRAPGGWWPW